MSLINIGFGNVISTDKVLAIISPDAAPVRRLIRNAKEQDKLIDGTCGRRTRAVIIFSSGHVVLSATMPETIKQRLDEKY